MKEKNSNLWRKAIETGDSNFEELAIQLFNYQAVNCTPYREYIKLIGCDPTSVRELQQIPFMPIELFKSHEIYCEPSTPEAVFTSSATTGSIQSRHPMESLKHYEEVSVSAFELQFGELKNWAIYALLPGYLEREGSSLIYMVERFVERAKGGGFYLRNHEELIRDMANDSGQKLLLGVSYALLDLLEKGSVNFDNLTIMETGGMKGVREEMTKEALHAQLCDGFSVSEISSEYGMAELTSQAYSKGGGLFTTPPWMRVLVRDINDPFAFLPQGARGGVNVIDLASYHSCAFIQTQDLGRVTEEGFYLEGRIDRSEIRGCNLLVE